MEPIATLKCVQNFFNKRSTICFSANLIMILLYNIDLALPAEGKVN